MSQRFPDRICSPQAVRDFVELFEGGFEVVDDFLGENVGIGKIAGSSRLSSLSQKISRLASSRFVAHSLTQAKPHCPLMRVINANALPA